MESKVNDAEAVDVDVDVKDFKQRVAEEEFELLNKIHNLKKFIDGDIFSDLTVNEQTRLSAQLVVMGQYHDILRGRIINDFSK